MLQLRDGGEQPGAAFFQLIGHVVKTVRQGADLVFALDIDPFVQAAHGNLIGPPGDADNRFGKSVGQHGGSEGRDQYRHEQDPPQPAAVGGERGVDLVFHKAGRGMKTDDLRPYGDASEDTVPGIFPAIVFDRCVGHDLGDAPDILGGDGAAALAAHLAGNDRVVFVNEGGAIQVKGDKTGLHPLRGGMFAISGHPAAAGIHPANIP